MLLLVKVQIQKSSPKSYREAFLSRMLYKEYFLFLSGIAVAAHELVYATGGVDQFGLTGVERV